tara:strand:- start:7624 stop:7998 length:375 start_codon:yes stop_codon:yes gene_type:complete
MSRYVRLCLGVALIGLSGHVMAEEAHTAHSPAAAVETHDKAYDYYADVMTTMHQNMMLEPTGDVDVDFMRGMIPHHEAAVSMAEIVLQHGEDAQVRTLAEQVITTQKAEIDMMKEWLAKRGYSK